MGEFGGDKLKKNTRKITEFGLILARDTITHLAPLCWDYNSNGFQPMLEDWDRSDTTGGC